MYQSEQTNELAAALAKAQAIVKPAKKNKRGHHGLYADLDSVLNACFQALAENGLSVHQTIEPWQDGLSLVTMLRHASGQWVKSQMPMFLQKHDPQSIGSVMTYYRRYTLAAIVGVAPGDGLDAEDDIQEEAPREEHGQTISREQVQQIANLTGGDEKLVKRILSFNQINRLEDLSVNDFARVVRWVKSEKVKVAP